MIPPEDCCPLPGWYRHHDVLRWYNGHQWTDRTRPLPDRPPRRRGSTTLYAVTITITVTVIGLGLWWAIA